jgi:hypothetical protein
MHLVGGITAAAASLIVDAVTGLPSVPFTLLLDPGANTEEVVTVTAVGGTVLTVTRGVGGTSGQVHLNGGEVRHAYYGQDFQDSRDHEANTTTAHGVTGAVVGTTNVQALTNKSVDGVTNTFTNVPSAAVVGLDAHESATTAHGVTGAVVGTTDAQTLTNKSIDGAANPLTNVPLTAVPALSTTYVPLSQKGAVNGVATLDANGLVPVVNMPALSSYALAVSAKLTTATAGFYAAATPLLSAPSITGDGAKKFKITANFTSITSTGANDIFNMTIRDSTLVTVLSARYIPMPATAGAAAGHCMTTVDVPAVGAHVYQLAGERVGGTGIATVQGYSNAPIEIIVEQIA